MELQFMRKKADFLVLLAELEGDMEILGLLEKKNRKSLERVRLAGGDELDWSALGYTLHNIYNLLENYFLRIAKFFENSRDPLSWHKDLVQRMALTVEEVRPALLGRDLASKIDELRAFRHVFRNIYQAELDPSRMSLIQDDLPATLDSFRKDHAAFKEKLLAIAGRLGD
jgi:hypothetical protein